jgi:hypothetical protein
MMMVFGALTKAAAAEKEASGSNCIMDGARLAVCHELVWWRRIAA